MNEFIPIEKHPLCPFLPKGAKVLMLGSFPPKRERWSMDFFYPNRQNDMWKMIGYLFFCDREHFIVEGENRFDRYRIEAFCESIGIALYDTAREVKRLKDNASDKFLEIVTPTDIPVLLEEIPQCTAIVATGQKAADVIADTFDCSQPKIGEMTEIIINERTIHFWRMPSTSRAYPLALEKKARFYKKMFETENCL